MGNKLIFHNSQDLSFRKPFGAVRINTKVELFLEVCNNPQDVSLEIIRFNNEKEKIHMNKLMTINGVDRYGACINLKEVGVIGYYFSLNINGELLYYGNNIEVLGGEGQIYYSNPNTFQITVYEESEVPSWYKEGIIYQIFVERFYNGSGDGKVLNPKKNSFIYGRWDDEPMYIKDKKGDICRWDFYGGNLKGVIIKLDYLKSLGVTIIYFNPIFKAASNHKYDTGDYKRIDEMFGDEDTFKELCIKARNIGIRIILDGVFSHTGQDSIYFNRFGNEASLGAYQSKESIYYNWYKFIKYPDEYECWWGIKDLPNVDELNPDYLDYIIRDKNSVIAKWMKCGVSGWRLDVADELPDKFIELLRERVKFEDSQAILIGEVWEDASNKVSYGVKRKYFLGKELDSVTNYPFRDAVLAFLKGNISSQKFSKIILSLKENYPKENFYSLMNIMGNHDTERLLTNLGNKKLMFLAIIIQMSMIGVPLIYYGDEVGVEGGKDPENRRTYPWGREEKDILTMYKKIISIRTNSEELKRGDIEFISTEDDVLLFKRSLHSKVIYIIINRSINEEREIVLPHKVDIWCKIDLITNKSKVITKGKLILKPLEGLIMI